MNVVIMNEEEKVMRVFINPKIEISYNPAYKVFVITINDVPYPTPYDEDTIWDFVDDWKSFILMQTDRGWIIDRDVERIFRGKEFEHYDYIGL